MPEKNLKSPGQGGFRGSRRSSFGSHAGGFRARHSSASRGGHADAGRRQHRGGRSPGGNFSRQQQIDISRFVNKAVITEKTENFVPEHAFADFHIDARIKANIAAKGYVTPTPIQDKAIPHVLRRTDLVGLANTGTGKTAAFLIPLIDKVLAAPQREKVLIVVPTRELALQIEGELRGFAARLNLHSVVCVGGASIALQMRSLSRPVHFLIGTPGRLKDLIERNRINLGLFSTVVLDEADRMLDMGFINDVKMMLGKMPPSRQTLFFSATTSREIDVLIKTFLREPVMISVKTGETAAHVEQDIVRIPPGKDKFNVLSELLRTPGFDKVLVFGRTKHGVERLARNLSAAGLTAESIHGNKNQNQRVRALKLFSDHHVRILVATDVAARGLDIAGVSYVINYDLPATYEDYVHRIGRTGRAGKRGKALTFV